MTLKNTILILYGVILVVLGSINQLLKNLVISIILVLSIIVFFVVLIWILVQFKPRKASENLNIKNAENHEKQKVTGRP